MSDSLLGGFRASGEYRDLAERLASRGGGAQGVEGSALAFLLAAWRTDPGGPPGPALVIAATADEADELADDLEVLAPGRARRFPAWESLFLEESLPDPEIWRDRLRTLEDLASGRLQGGLVVAGIQAILQPVPSAELLDRARRRLRRGGEHPPEELAETLVRHDYHPTTTVLRPGELSRRGDVLDVWLHCRELPLRLEFFGETLESIREFDPRTQRSRSGASASADEVTLLLPRAEEMFRDCFRGDDALLVDHFAPDAPIFVKEPELVAQRRDRVLRHAIGSGWEGARGRFVSKLDGRGPRSLRSLPGPLGGEDPDPRLRSVERFRAGAIDAVFESIRRVLQEGKRVEVWCESEAETARFGDLLADHGFAPDERMEVVTGELRSGFEIEPIGTIVLTSRELFGRHVVRRPRRRVLTGRAIDSFLELEHGDIVVHLAHGIGRYLGVEVLDRGGVRQECLVLEFRNRVKLYVPASKIDLVQKYIGSGDRTPVLDKVGGVAWEKKKHGVEEALRDLASDLLEVQALRRERPGLACSPDSEWQRQFEAAFPFRDTPDQEEITVAIKEDMEAPRPMDRLLCGDVGFGKTELAMRAAFKAVDSRRQVAVLVPTTVLAEQHYRTFGERMAEFPINIAVLSRFRSAKAQRDIVRRAAEGGIDILIGTHRILSEDVAFRDLGLVIVDEEQRFGVAHKEKLKRLRSEVDFVTLSATPIPRTLHMALLGLRDISSLTTAPAGRMPIRTDVMRYDRRRVREIVRRELDRDGQVLFIHNRILDMKVVKSELEAAMPEARIEMAHGRMKGEELEAKMHRFLEREIDLLVATTIIENGIDIPTANTIIIDEADRYGLADLHQLRGRVGRYKHQAYCYLLLPDHRHVQPDARKRLQALVEFSGLGSGFQIAMRDLEIRGAGNILGKEQSGHIATVGYDMYCRLLEKCVKRLRGQPLEEAAAVEIDLSLEAYIPPAYLPEEASRIDVYRRVASVEDSEGARDLASELEDRFGVFPSEVERLLELQVFRRRCARRGIRYVGREDPAILLRGGDGMGVLVESFPGRVAVLDAESVALPFAEAFGRQAPAPDDRKIFDVLRDWLATGEFPRGGRPSPAPTGALAAGGGAERWSRRSGGAFDA